MAGSLFRTKSIGTGLIAAFIPVSVIREMTSIATQFALVLGLVRNSSYGIHHSRLNRGNA